jgi:hypothetical protein
MNKALILGASVWLAGAVVSAAEIHGTASENGKPLPKGVPMKLDCGGESAAATTDEFGSYSLKIGATGECRLSLDYKGASPSLKVTVYERPSRYDVAVKEEAGKLVLARK